MKSICPTGVEDPAVVHSACDNGESYAVFSASTLSQNSSYFYFNLNSKEKPCFVESFS